MPAAAIQAAVKSLTRDDLVAFYQAWIRPDKAKIFVVSDRPLAEVKSALEARFGNWKGQGPAGVKAFTVAPQQVAPKIVLVDRPDSPQSLILAAQMTQLDPSSELLPQVTANQVLGSRLPVAHQHGSAREQALVLRREWRL